MKKWMKLLLAACILGLAACHKKGGSGGSSGGSGYLNRLTTGE